MFTLCSQGIINISCDFTRNIFTRDPLFKRCSLLSFVSNFSLQKFFYAIALWRQHESRKRKCLGITMMRWWSPLLNPNSFKFNLNKKLIIQKRHLIIFSNVLIKWIFILEHRKKFIEWLFRISNFFIFFNDSASKTTTTTIFFFEYSSIIIF